MKTPVPPSVARTPLSAARRVRTGKVHDFPGSTHRRHLLAAAGSLGLVVSSLLAAHIDYVVEGGRWWAHVRFLADDKLAGRNVGSEGLRTAVEYVTAEFERQGLRPAGTRGYLQPVPFESRQLNEAESGLWLVRDGKAEPLALGTEASLSPRPGLSHSLEAPMVFAGYGMVIPETRYDDLAGLDLRGKIVVYLNAPGPTPAPGPLKSHYSSGVERWAALRRAGAIGIATLQNPRTSSAGTNREPAAERHARGARGGRAPAQPVVVLADPALQETAGQSIAVSITGRGAEKFFEGSGHTFAEIEKLARANEPLPRFPLAASLRMQATVRTTPLEASNVAAVLPGTNRKLNQEYVILSAHIDHVGVGRPVNGDSIYNGAMDDASGIATVLEVARLLKQSSARPKRSILFLAVTAEENGELGSRYFAAHPTVPSGAIVADINLDMFLPLYPLKFLEVQGLAESTLGETVRAAAEALGVDVQPDNEPEQNRFIRSDQYSFIRRGIPALAFKFGYAPGSPAEKIRRDWVRDRYHKPSDDLSQPVDAAAAARFNRIILGLLLRVADAHARPHWYPESFFKRFAEPESTR